MEQAHIMLYFVLKDMLLEVSNHYYILVVLASYTVPAILKGKYLNNVHKCLIPSVFYMVFADIC